MKNQFVVNKTLSDKNTVVLSDESGRMYEFHLKTGKLYTLGEHHEQCCELLARLACACVHCESAS